MLSVTLEIMVIWRTNKNPYFVQGWIGDKFVALYTSNSVKSDKQSSH